MAKYCIDIDLSASMQLYVEADSFEDAEQKARKEMYNEDEFIDAHKKEIFIWSPVIDQIIEEEE